MYKVNDMVRVKSFDEIRKTLGDGGIHLENSGLYFPERMKIWCGKILRVSYVIEDSKFNVSENQWAWHTDWLEPAELDNRRIENV